MRFIDADIAERILSIANSSSSFAEVQERILEIVPRRLIVDVMRALELFYEEKEPYISENVKAAWRKYSGEFICLDRLNELIDSFCEKYGVDKETFLTWFNGRRIFERKRVVSPKLFAGVVNFFILRRILRRATKVIAEFPRNIGGFIVKEAVFIARRLGASIAIREEHNSTFIETSAGEESLEPLSVILGYAKHIEILTLNKRRVRIADIPLFSTFKPRVFDSSLERAFYNALAGLGVRIRKDPPVVLGDIIFVPDFEISIEEKRVYVEIVGYWRKRYIVDKEIKIRRAINMGIPLIIVVDERVHSAFRHLLGGIPFYVFKKRSELREIAKRIVNDILLGSE